MFDPIFNALENKECTEKNLLPTWHNNICRLNLVLPDMQIQYLFASEKPKAQQLKNIGSGIVSLGYNLHTATIDYMYEQGFKLHDMLLHNGQKVPAVIAQHQSLWGQRIIVENFKDGEADFKYPDCISGAMLENGRVKKIKTGGNWPGYLAAPKLVWPKTYEQNFADMMCLKKIPTDQLVFSP